MKPCGAPLVLDKEDEFLGTAPDTKGMEDSDPTDAFYLESWLRCHGSDRNRAYVPCANGHTVHITHLVNEYFNGNVEHASTDRLRRTAQTARFGQTPTNVNNVALPDNCNFDEDAVTVGAIFLALVTFIWGSQRTFSVLPQKKAVLGKGTKRPITATKQNAKKRCTVKTSGRKK